MQMKLSKLNIKNIVTAIAISCVTIFIFSCNDLNVYTKQKFFSSHEWHANDSLKFTFNIDDTISRYHVFLVLRHTDEYAFNNIWLNITSYPPQSVPAKQMLDLKLADNNSGWLGAGMGDIFEHKVKITSIPLQLKKGNYSIALQQAMRENPLKHVLNAGVRIEKVMQ